MSDDSAILYRRHLAMVRGRAFRLLGDRAAAEDLTQQAFMRFFDASQAGRAPRDAGALLFRIITNLALNLLRDDRRRAALLQAQTTDAEGSAHVDEQLALRQVLARVPEEDAIVATCYYFDGMEQGEIGRLLRLPRRTVSRRLERFHERARALLAPMREEAI